MSVLQTFAATDPGTGIFNYLFTQGVLGVVCVGLIIVVVYQQKKADRKEERYEGEIKALNALLVATIQAHANDYQEMAKDNQEVMSNSSHTLALFGEKIEIVKGRR